MSHTSSRIATATGVALASALGICAAATTTRTASADIISTVGLTQVTAPTLVTGDFLANSVTHQIIFAEKKGVMLANDLVTDTGTIAAGTAVDSYFFAVNVLQANPVIVNTSVTFDVPVLGIIYKDGLDPYGPNPGPWNPNFLASDFLGAIGTTYQLGPQYSACANFRGSPAWPGRPPRAVPAADRVAATVNHRPSSLRSARMPTPPHQREFVMADYCATTTPSAFVPMRSIAFWAKPEAFMSATKALAYSTTTPGEPFE